MFSEDRPHEYSQGLRPMMLDELLPAAASTSLVAVLGMLLLVIL
jgi:hypothetical protein